MRRLLAALVLLVVSPLAAFAEDAWVELKTPNFIVVSNGGEKRARDVAMQFERYRSAVQEGWPWARVQLDRPVVVLAAKDEATMRRLAPQFWEKGTRFDVASVFTGGFDAYYIALRSDIRAEDRPGSNPYFASYWPYTTLAFTTAFDRPLPVWFRDGLAQVLANSIVRDTNIQFGQPLESAVRLLVQDSRLRMREFLTTEATSPYYTNNATRSNFDAQAWGVMHYLLFGRPDDRADRVNQIAKLLLAGTPSVDAIQQVFGSVDALDNAYLQYVRAGVFRYEMIKTRTVIATDTFTLRPLDASEVAAIRARYHAAMNRPADARAVIAQTKEKSPAGAMADIDGMLFDREGKRQEARAAYAAAVDARTQNFFAYYRLATLESVQNPDAATLARLETLLRRSMELNDRFAPAQAMLADVMTIQGRAAEAIDVAKRAVALDPSQVNSRLALARALWRSSRIGDARGHVLAARTFASSDQEREAVQTMLDALDRASVAEGAR